MKTGKAQRAKAAVGKNISLRFYPDKPHEAGISIIPELQALEFICQQKIDGWRMILIRTETGFVALTRHNDSQYSTEFNQLFQAELEALLPYIPLGSQIDGEWFGRRQTDLELPHSYYIFDVLRWGKKWQINTELKDRLSIIERSISPYLQGQFFKIEEAGANNWLEYYQKQESLGYSEGVVIKALTGQISKMTANRTTCKKAEGQFKVKYRGGHDGNVKLSNFRN